jgi:hypothetical protein
MTHRQDTDIRAIPVLLGLHASQTIRIHLRRQVLSQRAKRKRLAD